MLEGEADFCLSATAGNGKDDFEYYDDEYGDAVETSIRELKESFRGQDFFQEGVVKATGDDLLGNVEVEIK